MIFKAGLTLLLFIFTPFAYANMASPIIEGTMSSSAYSSKDINILEEYILIKIDKEFKTAKFIVEYTIKSDHSGKQIPLLFYAKDYKDSFLIWVDNQQITIQDIPEKYTNFENSPFSGFKNLNNSVTIYWNKNFGYIYQLNQLKYFETNITKGVHKVRVEYVANVWTNKSGWIKKYSFRYSLTPAKFWKSFGKLNITVEQEGTIKQLSSNIGEPIETKYLNKNNWKFTKLKDEFLEFSYSPKVNPIANVLIIVQPLGLAIIAWAILFILHIFYTYKFRKLYVNKKYSLVVIIGSLLIPILIFLSYLYSYDLIEYVIGEEAGRHHGYTFYIWMYYPVITAMYWRTIWILDNEKKSKLTTEKK